MNIEILELKIKVKGIPPLSPMDIGVAVGMTKFGVMNKLIALDIGDKRIGVARSEGSFAFAFVAIENDGDVKNKLEEIISEESPEKIVVGLPRNMDGSLGFQAEKVKDFVNENLDKCKEMVEYEDESVTSIEAENIMLLEGKDPRNHKGLIDAYAAKIILESFIARMNAERNAE